MKPHTQRWSRALLRVCVPADRREDVLGDLEEMHARRLARSGVTRAWIATSVEAVVVGATFVVERGRVRAARATWLSALEIKLALRMARKQPLLNLAAVLALATGIGLSAASFHIIEMISFSRLPFADGDRFVMMRLLDQETVAPVSIHRDRFRALAKETDAFAYVGAATTYGGENILDADGAVEAVPGIAMSADAFRVLPYRPLLGRTLVPADDDPGATPVVVLSEALWRRRYGADPGVVGHTVNLSGTLHQIVGVLPAEAGFPNRPDVWTPLGAGDADAPTSNSGSQDGADAARSLRVFGVLREGVTLEAAQARLAALSAAWEEEHAGTERVRVLVRPFTEFPQAGAAQLALAALLAAVLAVLVVIAGNVGSLVAARTAARRSELAVRSALGAGRRTLVMQLFGEVLLLGVASAVLAAWGLDRLMAHVAILLVHEIPFWIDFMPGPGT